MKRIYYILTAIILLLSCSKDDIIPQEEPNTPIPTKTIVKNNVVVYNRDNSAFKLVSYNKNKAVFIINSSNGSSNKSKVSNKDLEVDNFNTKEKTFLKEGMQLSLPPSELVPEGALLEVSDIEYGAGSVIVWGKTPNLYDIIEEANITHEIRFVDFFKKNKLTFDFPTSNKDVSIQASISKSNDNEKIKLELKTDFNLFKQKSVKIKGTSAKGGLAIIGSCELDPVLTTKLIQRKNSKKPEVFDLKLEGEVVLKLDAEVAVQLKEYLEAIPKPIRIVKIGMPVIPLGPTPIYIHPYLILDINFSAKGELVAKINLYTYTYPFSYSAGYNRTSKEDKWYIESNSGKGYASYFRNNNFNFNANLSIQQQFEMGAYFTIMDWKGAEFSVGAGLKPKLGIKYHYMPNKEKNKKIDYNLEASLYLYGDVSVYALYDQIKFHSRLNRDIAKWEILKDSFSWGDDSDNGNTAPSITVTSPNGGESFTAGKTMTITWDSNNVNEDVWIELLSGGNKIATVVKSTENDGVYSWTIPTKLYGNDFKIRVLSSSGSYRDDSDNTFSITKSNTSGVPSLYTRQAYDITNNSANSGGYRLLSNGAKITQKGVCWSTSPNPTINNYVTNNGSGNQNFTSTMNNLTPNTTYYYRAFATNSNGTGYGNLNSFTTSNNNVPTVNTNQATNISYNSARVSGQVTSTGGATIYEMGFVWNTNGSPNINDSHISVSGQSQNNYKHLLSNLQPNTTYYVKAYAKNSIGIGYGNQISFTTDNHTQGGTITGNIWLKSQEQVNEFASNNYLEVDGRLNIIDQHEQVGGSPITDLSGLISLHTIKGTLQIKYNKGLYNLNGLNNISLITGNLTIDIGYDDPLESLEGLSGLHNINGNFYFFQRYGGNLTSLDGLENLTSIGGNMNLLVSNLCNYCALNNLFSNNGLRGSYSIQGSGSPCFIPTLNDLKKGNCRN